MPLRTRNGKLEWRFMLDGHVYSRTTDLPDTARNRNAATRMECDARRLVEEGRYGELKMVVQPFDAAMEAFLLWSRGEYAAHPASSRRLSGSLQSAVEMFQRKPLSAITTGDLEDYKSRRRATVKDITVRHDLHALSLLFQYGKKHNWNRGNPVDEIDIPSDADAVRCRILSTVDELRYLAALDALDAIDLRDIAILMLNQGCRPEELRDLRDTDVDLVAGTFTIRSGKSKAAARTLPMTAASRDVFVRRYNRPRLFEAAEYHRAHEQALRLSGLTPRFVVYDLRHTWATRAVERGVELPKIAAILGHANLRSVMRYVHLGQQHVNEGMRRFEAGAVAQVVVERVVVQ